ncbi:MAG: hypothetical protein RL885_00940 [Planctomycetota bacterium]
MAITEPTAIRLTLVHCSGPFPPINPGHMNLTLWLSGLVQEDGGKASGTLVEADTSGGKSSLREFQIEGAELLELVELLQDAGFPDRKPKIQSALDSTDRWGHFLFHVYMNGDVQMLDLEVLSTSYEGEGARPMQRFFKRLLDLVGAEHPRARFDLTKNIGD